MSTLLIEPSSEQTSRSDLIAAFKRVIKRAGRPQATDLHVRRLLLYVQAKDHDGTGLQRSLKQLADKLFLTVSTCRRVIRRAVKRFGLLTVIEQRHTPGGQTVNRYTINWEHVDALLCNECCEKTIVGRSKSQPSSGSASEIANILKSRARSKRISSSPSNLCARRATTSDTICQSGSDRLAPNEVSDMPVRLAPPATTDQPPAISVPVHDFSVFHFYPLSFTPDALSDLPATFESRARSKRILRSSVSTLCPPVQLALLGRLLPQRFSGNSSEAPVSIEQPDNTTARAACSARISKVDFSPANFLPGALSDHASKNKSTEPMPVRLGPTT